MFPIGWIKSHCYHRTINLTPRHLLVVLSLLTTLVSIFYQMWNITATTATITSPLFQQFPQIIILLWDRIFQLTVKFQTHHIASFVLISICSTLNETIFQLHLMKIVSWHLIHSPCNCREIKWSPEAHFHFSLLTDCLSFKSTQILLGPG